MSSDRIIAILGAHGVPWQQIGNRVEAADVRAVLVDGRWVERSSWIDVTNWTSTKLAEWLGY